MKAVLCVVGLFVLAVGVQATENGLLDSSNLSDINEYDELYDYETDFDSNDANFFDNENEDNIENGIQEVPININKDYQFEDNRFNETNQNNAKKRPTESSEQSHKKLKENIEQNHTKNNNNSKIEITSTTTKKIETEGNDSGNMDDTLFRDLFVDSIERRDSMMELSSEFDDLFKTLDSMAYDGPESKDDILEYEEINERPYKEGNILSFREEKFDDVIANILSQEIVGETYQKSLDRSENSDESDYDEKDNKKNDKYDSASKNFVLEEKVFKHSYGNDGLVDDRMPINKDAEIFSTTEAASASQTIENDLALASKSRNSREKDALSLSTSALPLSSTSEAPLSTTREHQLTSTSRADSSSESVATSLSLSVLPFSSTSESPDSLASRALNSSINGPSSSSTNGAPSSLTSEHPPSSAKQLLSSSLSEVPHSLTSTTRAPYFANNDALSSLTTATPSSLASELTQSTTEAISHSEIRTPYYSASKVRPSLASKVRSSTLSASTSDDQNRSQYNQLMSRFVMEHSAELDTNSQKFLKNVAPIHIKLSVDEPTVITSPEYPDPYPTNNVVDWILEGPGMGIEMNITDFQVNGALGDYLLVKPGGIDETGTEGLVFSFQLKSQRKYRFLNVNRMFVRFEAKMGMQFFKGFSFSVKMIWPPRRHEAQELEQEPVINEPIDTLTLSLAGVSMPRFHEIMPAFRALVADMAEEYIVDNDIDEGLNTTAEVTQITKTAVCNIRWPNYETCVDVTFGVPLQYGDENLPPRLTSEDLDLMWATYITQEPYASRFRELGVTEYDSPAENAALMMWMAIALGIIISMSMLFFVVWRFRCLEDYTRMKSYIDVDIEHTGKKYNELYPTPHQSLPPLPNDLDCSWSQKLSFGNASNNAYSNKSFEQDDSTFDLDSDSDERPRDRRSVRGMV